MCWWTSSPCSQSACAYSHCHPPTNGCPNPSTNTHAEHPGNSLARNQSLTWLRCLGLVYLGAFKSYHKTNKISVPIAELLAESDPPLLTFARHSGICVCAASHSAASLASCIIVTSNAPPSFPVNSLFSVHMSRCRARTGGADIPLRSHY